MRNKIFISHANPEDNDQARWLGLQLMTLGYEVWCDVFNLKGGEKFWKEIENEIRNNTCKFLYVLTKYSNQREGCLDELAIAEAVEKTIDDNRFIIALHFDPDLTYDELNIRLKRKIDLNFKIDWQQGFKGLLGVFYEKPVVQVSQDPDFNFIRDFWNKVFLNGRKPIEREETYSSNWFQIMEYPKYLFIHNFKGMIPKGFNWNQMPFPTCGFKRYTASFAPASDFIRIIQGTKQYDPENSRMYIVENILSGQFEDSFVTHRALLNIINFLLRTGFINTLKAKGLTPYEMSGKTAFCFMTDQNNEKLSPYGQLVGKLKEKNWHFAISGFPDLSHNVFVVKSHILLSENGAIVDSKKVQQSGRRRQGTHWWNKHWKQKLLSIVSLLADENSILQIGVGPNQFVNLKSQPVSFRSMISYIDPDETKEALDDFPEEDDVEILSE